jgi:hypothetical protein
MVPHRASGRAVPCLIFFLCLLCALAPPSWGQERGSPPTEEGQRQGSPPPERPIPRPATGLAAVDTPNDPGDSIDLTWAPSPDEPSASVPIVGYAIERALSPQGPFEHVGRVPLKTASYTDNGVKDGTSYFYRVRAEGLGEGDWQSSNVFGPITSKGQWFDLRKTPTLIMTALFCLAVVLLIAAARRGRTFYIRPIPGLSAVDEAIGRATEMGKPILFVPGIGVSGEVATLAAFTLLGRVAKKTAEYQTQVLVPCYDPIVMTISQEIVKSSYLDAGRPELYREQDVYFITQDQFGYTAAVAGIMLREHPATNFYIGKFYAESLVLAETGNIAGSIQIAGTDEITQIPFFVAACDYTLIGEELYASSAYLSQEPPLLGTLKAQDYGKAIGAILIALGAIMAALNQHWFVNFFRVE